jgi:hypothetical protein
LLTSTLSLPFLHDTNIAAIKKNAQKCFNLLL